MLTLDDYLDAFCRHVVSLLWLDKKREPDGPADDICAYDPKAFAVSAFVISVRNIWFLVTAGHILRDLDERLRAGRKIVKSGLMDGLVSRKSFHIPFNLGDTPKWYVCDDGLDYALIPLRPAFVRQLIAGGVCALGENAWTNIPDSPDGCFLVGFPNQGADITITPDGVNFSLGTPLIPVRLVDDPPEILKRGANRIYAKVPTVNADADGKKITLTDIDGISGGPLFVVKNTDEHKFRYWVVAIQSGWAPQSRVLAACPIQPLVDAVAQGVDAQRHAMLCTPD